MLSYKEFVGNEIGENYCAYWGNWEDSYLHYCKDNGYEMCCTKLDCECDIKEA